MAGHSKWANIRFRKSLQDSRRGKLFTKLIRVITVCARQGGADPQTNPALRTAIDKALSANMTRDIIDRAIKRGAGGQEGQDYEEIRYEGFGPGGVALIIDCLTNNRQRTVSDVRHLLSKHGGNLAIDGAVAYLFSERGQIHFSEGALEERIMEVALEAGAEDVLVEDDGTILVTTGFQEFGVVKAAFEAEKLSFDQAELTLIPSCSVVLGLDEAMKLTKLVDLLEELDDVQAVHSNADIPEEVLATLA